jgi:hypothetical protein
MQTAIAALVDRYAAGATLPAELMKGLSKAELNSFPVPGTWSIQQIVLHLMDSDLIGSERMKRTIAMTRPLLLSYDETAFTSSLKYEKADANLACEVFRLNRVMTTALLRELPPDAFTRKAVHSESGLETLEDLVRGYADHLDHHAKFMREKCKLLGRGA